MQTKDDAVVVKKLMYLWAFAEAGLGGLLHLLHIPLTGFIVGGFAVIVLVLLAVFGQCSWQVFIKALSLVLAVKFLVSPHSPAGAYIAVCFQGMLAVILFSAAGVNRMTIVLFAVLAMAESGLQKPLMAYILFGKEFWTVMTSVVAGTLHFSRICENILQTFSWMLAFSKK